MKFLNLHDPFLKVLFENDDIVAIDKPYGIDTHTNDSKVGNEDFIQPGLIELFEKQLGRKLQIVHRLDQTTTGVIVFAKTPESAKIYQDFFRQRETKKTYLFITDKSSDSAELSTDKEIVHKGSTLDASTAFVRLSQTSRFALWEAKPRTGRNHQIRIHAAHLGLPLIGDSKYGGSNFAFLCLHNRRIEFPNGLMIESEPPVYFDDLSLLESRGIAKVLFEVDRRKRLFATATEATYRLVHRDRESGDFSLDHLGRVLFLSWYKEAWHERDREFFIHVSARLGQSILVRLMNLKAPSGKARQVLLTGEGEMNEISEVTNGWTAIEDGVLYEFRADSGPTAGLFLDQRLVRHWLRSAAKEKNVLILFANTCSLGLVAVLGGASHVTCVDAGKNNLNWGRTNFELNAVDVQATKFFCRDSLTFLEQARVKRQSFDLIVVDLPGFYRRESGVFKIETGLHSFLENAFSCLNAEGTLIFSTGFEGLSVDDLRRAALKAAGAKKISITSLQPPLDFELPGARAATKAFFFQLTV